MLDRRGSDRLAAFATLADRRQHSAILRGQPTRDVQAATWDPTTIDRELGFAEAAGMNTMRVFLHDLLWANDSEGFSERIAQFLTLEIGINTIREE
jgi:hypothetical protein